MRSLRLLVVDDDPLIRAMVTRLLERAGHRVVTASDGHEGYLRFRNGLFDGVISDRSMPVMDGDRMALEIKREDAHMPIIMITTLAPGPGEPMPVGVDLVLTKPVSGEVLEAALKRVCRP